MLMRRSRELARNVGGRLVGVHYSLLSLVATTLPYFVQVREPHCQQKAGAGTVSPAIDQPETGTWPDWHISQARAILLHGEFELIEVPGSSKLGMKGTALASLVDNCW